jgi:hypothetical protein
MSQPIMRVFVLWNYPEMTPFIVYAVFARPGGIVEEEIHTEHNEVPSYL